MTDADYYSTKADDLTTQYLSHAVTTTNAIIAINDLAQNNTDQIKSLWQRMGTLWLVAGGGYLVGLTGIILAVAR